MEQGGGRCVNSSITGDTRQQPMPSSHQSGSSISLCKTWQLPVAPTQLQSRSTPGSRRADPPRNHPSFMGCNPSPEWVTGARGTHWVGGQWALLWASLSLCPGKVHHVCLCRWFQKSSACSLSFILAEFIKAAELLASVNGCSWPSDPPETN